METTQTEETKTPVNKTELKEFVNYFLDCWNNQLFLDEETEKRLEQGIKTLLIPASEEGDLDAIFCMAKLYDSGKWSVRLDEEKALAFAHLLAKKGRPDWQITMGFFYEDGGPVRRSSKKAFEWFMKAAEQGSSWGQFLVAECYSKGSGVRRSYQKALFWYMKAAEQGDEDAMFQVGLFYCFGLGVKKDNEKGYEWIEKSGCQTTLELLKMTENNRGGFVDYSKLTKGADPSKAR